MIKAAAHRIADNIPGDQEVGRKPEFVDDGQFVMHPFQRLRVVAIAVFPSVKRELLKQQLIIVPAPGEELLVSGHLEIKGDGTIIEQLFGGLKDLRKIGKGNKQIIEREEDIALLAGLLRGNLTQQGVVINGTQVFME